MFKSAQLGLEGVYKVRVDCWLKLTQLVRFRRMKCIGHDMGSQEIYSSNCNYLVTTETSDDHVICWVTC